MLMCGYFGCHVGNRGECECTKCSSTTGHCTDCTQFPNRARRDGFLCEAMARKCKMCRDAVLSHAGED